MTRRLERALVAAASFVVGLFGVACADDRGDIGNGRAIASGGQASGGASNGGASSGGAGAGTPNGGSTASTTGGSVGAAGGTGGAATGSGGVTSSGGTASGGTVSGGATSGGATSGGTGGMPGGKDGRDGDYYVAVDGDDSNPGTIDKPFATLQRAIEAAEPGQRVYVRGGVYEIVNGATAAAGVSFWKSGTSDTNRIEYFAFPGEVPVFDFSKLEIQPDPNYTSGFYVSGAWLHLEGFEVRNVPMNTRSNTGVSVGGGAHHDIFELLNIHHNFGSGMFIHTTTGGHRIIDCDSHDNYDPYSHQGDGQNADGFGVHYQETGEVTVFSGCRAWWNSDDGWDFISQEVPVVVENSWAIANGYVNSGMDRPADGNGNGFKIGSSKTGIRHIVRHSVAWGNRMPRSFARNVAG